MHVMEKGYTNTDTDSKVKSSANSQNGQENVNKITNYFYSSTNKEADKRKSIDLMKELNKTYGDVFNGIGCFKGTFSLHLMPDSKPYQVPPRCVVYVLQKPFKEELE